MSLDDWSYPFEETMMSCLVSWWLILSFYVMPWDFLSHDIISTVIHDPLWPHLSHDIIACFSLLKLYFNFYFFLLSPSFYILLPFISFFLLYPTSFYIQLSLLTICPTLFLRLLIMMFSLVNCNPRLYDCSPFNIID